MIIEISLILWYLIGSIGGILLWRKTQGKCNLGDFIFFFTIGGILGPVNVGIGLSYNC